MASEDQVPNAVDGVNDEEFEEIFTLPDIDEDPDGLAICMVRQDLEVSLLLDDGEQDYNILMANYHSKEPKDWNWNIYMQYIRNSSALDHVHVLFKEPEEINLEGLKELFEDSICNKVAVEVVDCKEMTVCVQELQGSSDIEFGYSNSCDSGDIVLSYGLASKLNGIMIVSAVIQDYYRAAVSLSRIITQIMDYNEREYIRFLYDRGRRAS